MPCLQFNCIMYVNVPIVLRSTIFSFVLMCKFIYYRHFNQIEEICKYLLTYLVTIYLRPHKREAI